MHSAWREETWYQGHRPSAGALCIYGDRSIDGAICGGGGGFVERGEEHVPLRLVYHHHDHTVLFLYILIKWALFLSINNQLFLNCLFWNIIKSIIFCLFCTIPDSQNPCNIRWWFKIRVSWPGGSGLQELAQHWSWSGLFLSTFTETRSKCWKKYVSYVSLSSNGLCTSLVD